MGLREVKSELSKQDKATLIKHISELYKKYKPVKEYFDFYINPDESKILEQYKEKVTEGFFPLHGYEIKLSISRKAISDFKKLGTSNQSLADLLLHFVEKGVELTKTYGNIDENFYSSLENTYAKSLSLIEKNGLLDIFQGRAFNIVEDTANIGWGFHDYLGEVYGQYYE